MNISFLREFIVSVPTCHEALTLAEVWQLFRQSGAEQILVNRRVDRQPLSVLRLCRFITILPLDSSEAWPQADLLQDWPNLLEPVRLLQCEADLASLQAELKQGINPAGLKRPELIWVDSTGQWVGLLDQGRLISALQAEMRPDGGVMSLPLGYLSSSALAFSPFPDPLIDLLERLPLPLMLQTSAGRVVSQNLAWRQQVGEIQHPQRIRRAAARILETALSARERGAGQETELASPFQVQLLQADAHAVGTCQLGPEPDTCVCICPMKTGQDRVWQFIKIPMGTSQMLVQPANEPPTDWATDWSTNWEADWPARSSPFKLASLKFSPDPNWRDLIQTERLWLVWAEDMTEQQQLAKELAVKNADLIQLNRLKDEFLACISHELKTPLTAILGMSSLLKDQQLGSLNERQLHYAKLIYQGGRHLVAIVNNILDLTRTETGQLELLLEPIHISTLCQQTYEQSRQLIESAEPARNAEPVPALNFRLEIQPELDYIVADELRLRQMLTNLLSNAIKFTEPGGAFGLQVEAWEGWIAFTVWDTGIGIPSDKQHLVFQKFQQLEQTMTRQFQGTGLGLVLTQQLARLHGGDVTFTSTLGSGSRFTLLLPPVPPQSSSLEAEARSTLTEHNRLLLIIEADAERLAERTSQLAELGYRAVIARSGTEAIEKARRLQPAAILLNPLLPLLSGWDVLTLLKADESTGNIPLVVTALWVEREQALQHGADGFLSMPVEAEALQHCLGQLIDPVGPAMSDLISDLTVLHLYEGSPTFTLVSPQMPLTGLEAEAEAKEAGINRLLHPYHCRVLEVDDLDQADLLARVWKPDLVLIDRIQTDPQAFIQALSQSALARLPLITLTAELTQAAYQVPSLSVFPYLAMEEASALGESDKTGETEHDSNSWVRVKPTPQIAELVQIMQLAAGISWVPNVLIADCGSIQTGPAEIRPPVRALVQYLQTAGFRSAVCQDWQQIQHKLRQQSVDLLLLCVSSELSPDAVAQMVQELEQPHRPPIFVWEYQIEPLGQSQAQDSNWNAVATQIFPTSTPILELLAQINRALAERRQQSRRSL